MAENAIPTRAELVERMRARLAAHGARTHMALLVAATAGVGMAASVGLLAVGLHVMWLRYAIATCVAYGGFLLFVRVWIVLARAGGLPDGVDVEEALDATSRAVDLGLDSDVVGFDLDLAGGSAVVPAVLLCVALVGAVAAGFLVAGAPVFFAEVLVDAALSYGLYRRLSSVEPSHWLQTAVSRTWIPFLAVAVALGTAGAVIHWYVPDAVSVGDLWRLVV
jgi:hypothetical protein